MNVMLQSFIANPLLRNYYLSDKHNRKLCKVKDCTSCEMDKLFSEVTHFSNCKRSQGLMSFLSGLFGEQLAVRARRPSSEDMESFP